MGGSSRILGKISSLEEWSGTAQGGGGVPGDIKECLDVVVRDMIEWGNIDGRWVVGLDDLGSLF